VPDPGAFFANLTGTHAGLSGDETALPDFHETYAFARGKPMAVAETAAFFNAEAEGDEVAVKTAWLDEVFSLDAATHLLNLRMVIWFDQVKPEPEVGGTVDWRVSHRPELADRFRDRVEQWVHITR